MRYLIKSKDEKDSKMLSKKVYIIDDEGNSLTYYEGMYLNKGAFVGDGELTKRYATIDGIHFYRRDFKSKQGHEYHSFIRQGRGRVKQTTLNKLQKLVDYAVEQFRANEIDRGDFSDFCTIEKTIN